MKILLSITLLFLFSNHSFSKDNLPNIEEVCKNAKDEIKNIELRKRNLKKDFKNIDNELEQFELLPKLTKDVNAILKQQILQAKLYHYLDCSRYEN